ncbi:MAG: acyl dehydratase [Ilumatobacteraceae bacterium]|nr:acyl dehydratase [Ilumatobacteraceae bacterium]
MGEELPRPVAIDATRPFWDGLAAEEVRLQRCRACNAWVFYPRPRCPSCLSDDLEWHTVSGRGTVYSYTVARQATHPAFAAQVPQLLAIVELDEGVRMTTTLVGLGPDEIRIGLPVLPVFDHGSDGITLLRFRPAAAAPLVELS